MVAASLVAEVKVTGVNEGEQQLKRMSETVDKTQGGFKSMLSGALSFAGGIGIFNLASNAVGFLKDQFSGMLQESMDAQDELAQTNKVLQTTHDASGETSQAILDLASNFSHLTKFTDDQVQIGENLLLTFTNIGKNVFPQATQTMLDLSQAMGQDVKSSAIQLGKALNDPLTGMTALQRVGVTFDTTEKNLIKTYMQHNELAKAQGVILKELQKEFGGSAEAAGKTFGGQLAILNQRMDDVKQTIGDALMPILSGLVKFVSEKIAPKLADFADWFVKTGLPNIQNFVSGAGGAFSKLQPIADSIGKVFTGIVSAIQSPEFAALANTLNGIFAPALQKVGEMLSGPFQSGMDTLEGFKADDISTALRQAAESINIFIEALGGFQDGSSQFVTAGLQVRDAAIQVWDTLQQVNDFLATAYEPSWNQIVRTIQTQVIPAWDDLKTSLTPLLPTLAKLAEGMIGITLAIDWVFLRLAGYVAQVLGGIIQIVSGAFQALAGSAAFFVDLFTLNFAQLGPDLLAQWNGIIDIFRGALNILNGITGGALDAMLHLFGTSIDQINAKAADMNKSTSKSTGDMSKNVQGSFSSMSSGSLGSVQTLSSTAQRLFQQMNKNATGQMASLDQSTIQYWNDIASYIDMESRRAAMAANENFSKIRPPGNIGRLNTNDPSAFDSVPGNASGTDYAPGGLSWVGERGPELVYLPRGAQVIPNSKLNGGSSWSGSGGGRSGPVQINIQVDRQTLASVLVEDIMELAARQTRVRYGNRGF